MSEWDRFVKITFQDGRVREIPLPQWNEGYKERIEDAGGVWELPPDPDIPMTLGKATKVFIAAQDDEETDEGLKELLIDIETKDLNEWEEGFVKSVTDPFRKKPLTPKQVQAAMNVIRRHRRKS